MATIAVTGILSAGSGTITTTTSYQTLGSGNVAGVFELQLDRVAGALVEGDIFTVKVSTKVNAGSAVILGSTTFGYGLAAVRFGPFAVTENVIFEIIKIAGTNRSIPWKILNYEGA